MFGFGLGEIVVLVCSSIVCGWMLDLMCCLGGFALFGWLWLGFVLFCAGCLFVV